MTATAIDPAEKRRDRASLPDAAVLAALQEQYALDGTLVPLSAETRRLDTASGERFVAHIGQQGDRAASLELQSAALQHIAQHGDAQSVPAVHLSRDGHALCDLSAHGDEAFCLQVLTYPGGERLSDHLDAASGATFRDVGKTLAELDRALRGFFHASADQTYAHNIALARQFVDGTNRQQDPNAHQLLASVLARFETAVVPRLQSLRHQLIHQNAHSGNVRVDPGSQLAVTGITGFNNMAYGTLVAEIAAACDVPGGDIDSTINIACELVAGYDTITALEEEELDLLFDSLVARHALMATNPLDECDRHTRIVDHLLTKGQFEFDRRVRLHSRFPVHCPDAADAAKAAIDEAQLIEDRRRLLGEKTTHFYAKPLHFERASGALLYGTDGRDYLDCYNNVPQVGHCNPYVVRAIGRQAAALNTNTRYLYSSVLEYADRLTAKLAPHLDACVFVNSGSEANDVAWQMAQRITGRSGAILMEDAYHGVTEVIREFSPGRPDRKLAPHLRGLMVPDPYRGPIRDDEADIAARYAADAKRAIDELDDAGHQLAAFMIDSAFCSSGVPNVPAGYLQEVERHVRAAGGLMICDEVQSGFGRMGQWWGHELHDVRADFVTMGKPVANGHPFGVVVTTSEILNEFIDQTRFFSTFGGNTVSCAAANAVLDVIERDQLIDNGNAVGDYLRSELAKLAEEQPLIGDIRGHGMLTGLEFVTDRKARTPATAEVAKLLELMRERQVLVGSEGRDANILKLRPPLVFEHQHVDRLIAALDDALHQV